MGVQASAVLSAEEIRNARVSVTSSGTAVVSLGDFCILPTVETNAAEFCEALRGVVTRLATAVETHEVELLNAPGVS